MGFPRRGRHVGFGGNVLSRALGTTRAGNKRAGVVLVKVSHLVGGPAACGAEALALFGPHAGILWSAASP